MPPGPVPSRALLAEARRGEHTPARALGLKALKRWVEMPWGEAQMDTPSFCPGKSKNHQLKEGSERSGVPRLSAKSVPAPPRGKGETLWGAPAVDLGRDGEPPPARRRVNAPVFSSFASVVTLLIEALHVQIKSPP